MDPDSRYRSRKFILAMIYTVSGVAALFLSKIGGGEFIGLAGVVLALYGAANVTEVVKTGDKK